MSEYKYFILFVSTFTFGIAGVLPLALADTVQVTIFPGSGSSQYCTAVGTCFNPNLVNISPGDTVTWTNNDNVAHTVTSGRPYANQTGLIFNSSLIAPRGTFSFTFQNPGTYPYFCQIDKYMVGGVIVGASAQSSPTVPEFGTLARLIVLVSIIGVIVITRTFMKSHSRQ